MITYQSCLYSAKLQNSEYGWDYDQLIFQSKEYVNPTEAMEEFNNQEILVEHWIGTLKRIEGKEVLDEEIFDSSVMKDAQ